METRSMKRARLQLEKEREQESCQRHAKMPKPATPDPHTLSVLDLTSRRFLTLAMTEDGVLETVDALAKRVQNELKKVAGEDELPPVLRLMTCGPAVVWRKRDVVECNMTYLKTPFSKTLDYFLLDGEPWMVVASTPPLNTPGDFKIYITASNETFTLHHVSDRSSVLDIKVMIEEQEGTPVHEQRLFFEGNQLCDTTLGEMQISGEATLHLLQGMSGGGGFAPGRRFVDLSNSSGLTRQDWDNSNQTMWLVALPGLCLEGVCENEECDAYNHWVIMNWHFTQFDLIDDAHECRCPSCNSSVIPTTCAFNNCKWRWVGKKIDSHTRCPVILRSHGWNTADDAYHRFDEETSGSVNWLHLKITTEEIEGMATCRVCFRTGADTTLHCGHSFHTGCANRGPRGTSTCPVCLAVTNMTSYQRREAGL